MINQIIIITIITSVYSMDGLNQIDITHRKLFYSLLCRYYITFKYLNIAIIDL